ncbi:MAG TPA: hypothetical protein VEK08_09375 [Planctomycetota bacterium]|nr:hypothetical protein [Planctomycetota bacterium]
MKRYDAQVLKLYGLTEEDARDPAAALLSEGVKKMFKVVQFMKLPVDLGDDGLGQARVLAEEKNVPLWRSMTGLFPDSEGNMSPEKREQAVEQLVGIVLKLLRFEMKADAEAKNLYHTPYWDPLPKICARLGIANCELSRLSKEACGLAAHELVDVVRVKAVKDQMKEHVRMFIAAIKEEAASSPPGTEDTSVLSDPLALLKILRQARRGPQFHRGQWALTLGFPTYARFYRASLVFYQLAPQQLELVAIEEVLAEIAAAEKAEQGSAAATVTPAKPKKKSVSQRLAYVVWAQLKQRHVQFFADLKQTVLAEAC